MQGVLFQGLRHFADLLERRLGIHLRQGDRTWHVDARPSDAIGLAVALFASTGRADIMVDPAMYLWDSAPMQVIMEEAGGTFTDWKGKPTIHGWESIATNGKLFEQVMHIVQS